MGKLMSPSAPKTDPDVARQRQETAARAAEQERLMAARESERARAIGLGLRGQSSLISAGSSAGFTTKTTIGG